LAAFIPGYPPSPARFLARFLPPLAEGVAADYLERYSQPGNLILDPFGQAPAVAVEALHLRRRVLVVSFNPISRLAVSLGVRPPTADELRRALTLLGDTRRENERLESYVRGLYQTTCAACDTEVMADEFEWEAGELITKTYLCPHCGGPPQTVPASDADKARAARFTRQRLDYHFLLERVAPLNDPDRPYAQEVIEVYPARALAALAACLSKFETLEAGSETRRLVSALIVSACDEACPLGPDRPRQLIAPKRYTEVNVWLALERAVSQLAGERGANIPAPEVMPLPTLLAPGRTAGIHAFTGPARDLAPQLPPAVCALMLTAFPRPNQAYWTLSAVWSAWLWGRESAATLRAVLRRRRYDWEWHADGLSRTLTGLRPALAANPAGNLIGLLPEAEPGFWAGVMIALNRAGFQVTGAALRADTSEAQLIGHTAVQAAGQPEAADLASTIQTTALEAAQAALRARAEPTRWPHVHFNAWRGLAERGLLAHAPEEPLGTVNRWLEPIFRKATNFQRFDAQAGDDLTTGLWAVPDDGIPAPSLTDQVELETWRILANAGAAPLHTVEVMRALCQTFTGPTTPSQQVVSACLHSYAVETQPEQWRLRPEDAPGKRAGEAEELRTQLRALAARHGYAVAVEGEWIEWREADQTVYRFGVTASAALSALVRSIEKRARRNFFVLPGSRVALAAFKLRRNPGLHIAFIEQNCLLVKFRHLRRMLTDAQLTRATLEPAFAADPPEEAQQLSLMADSRFA
jgi:hypothetical protein